MQVTKQLKLQKFLFLLLIASFFQSQTTGPKIINIVLQSNKNNQHTSITGQSQANLAPLLSFWEKIKQNKWNIAQLSMITGWSAIQASAWYLENQLKQKSCWSFWKNEKKIEELYLINQNELKAELIAEIHRRYGTTNAAISKFINEVEIEKKNLQLYANISKSVNRVWLKLLFWFNNDIEKEKAKRLQRLAFLSSIIFTIYYSAPLASPTG